MFGVSTIEEIMDLEDYPELPYIEESEINTRTHAIIERLKENKEGQ